MCKRRTGPSWGRAAADERERQAVVLLSGGLDSATTLAIAKHQGYAVNALSFAYGQRHRIELSRARTLARRMGARRHLVIPIDLRRVGGSALTSAIAVPKGRPAARMARGIPVTYVPGRNTLFLAFALGWAETLGAGDIFIGVNALDYSGYPDCRPRFIHAFERMANLALKEAVEGHLRIRIHTPLIRLTKAQIVRRAVALGVDLALTHSCYDPAAQGRSCGRCDACILRLKGFREAGLTDPIPYVARR